MGVLDDAIKEHLDLKRQHGASEDELQKQEAEALGPARSGAPAPPADDGGPDAPPAEDAPLEEPRPVDETAPVEAADEVHPRDETVASLEFEPDEVPREEALEAPLEEAGLVPPPEPEPEPGPEPEESEDVLEETPDFLQETPEHDRLWFEQKPPRDFDFDE